MSVDVLMPIHGSGEFLLPSIESFNQFSVPKSNLVLILDRPDEQIIKVIETAKLGSKFRVLTSPGSGIVDALNFGINNSSAEYIARLDSDDLLMAGRLKEQIQILDSNLDIVCVGTQVELIDSDGHYLGFTRYPTDPNNISQRLQFQNCIAHPSVMFRRSFNTTTFLYRKAFTGAEDYDLWLRMNKIGKIVNLNQRLTKYRVREGQYSSTFGNSIRQIEDLSRVVNVFPTFEVDFNRQLGGDECAKLFRLIIKKNVSTSPKLCAELMSSHYLGQIIRKSAGNRKIGLKALSVTPDAIFSFLFSPKMFNSFCMGLFKNRTIKAKK